MWKGDSATVIKWLETKVVPYKRLRGGICFVDEIPKSGSGRFSKSVEIPGK